MGLIFPGMNMIIKQTIKNSLLALAALQFASCVTPTTSYVGQCEDQSLDQVQMIGSHNSYRLLPPRAVLEKIDSLRPGYGEKLEYQHPTLQEQLNLGLRLLELDFYADPNGGHYSDPPNLLLLGGTDPRPFDEGELSKPGFKVMHIQGYDNYSHCLHLRDCLQDLKAWSDQHPAHSLVTVTLNVKEDRIFDGLPQPHAFDAAVLDDLDNLLKDVFGEDRILKPDDVRGGFDTLREAIVREGWPDLKDTRQQFMFVLDESKPDVSLRYREGHPSLRGRVMFGKYDESDDEAAFLVYWDIFGFEEKVASLVELGFLVRVSSDISTYEARRNDTSRLQAAIASGAQFIASDYYPGHTSPFETEYLATFEDGSIMQCRAAGN